MLSASEAARELGTRLENGSVMNRTQFHAVYTQFEEVRGVELIEGVVYRPMPIPWRHSQVQGAVIGLVTTYAWAIEGDIEGTGSATVLLDELNEVEPDSMLLRKTPGWLGPDGYIAKVPELIVEVVTNSHARELHQKKRAYERNGVREYLVFRFEDREMDWFELTDGVLTRRLPGPDGTFDSREFPGFVVDATVIFAGLDP